MRRVRGRYFSAALTTVIAVAMSPALSVMFEGMIDARDDARHQHKAT